jgi:hypothetical protein
LPSASTAAVTTTCPVSSCTWAPGGLEHLRLRASTRRRSSLGSASAHQVERHLDQPEKQPSTFGVSAHKKEDSTRFGISSL